MKSTFLENILEKKRQRVEALKADAAADGIRERAYSVRADSRSKVLRSALEATGRINIIAEFKRASPSKGIINEGINVTATARSYESGGACAISVLTEEDFFKGSLNDLRNVRAATSLPILRKDFVIDKFQIYEAAEAGADAILLIVAALPASELQEFYGVAETLGMDALVEVHDRKELDTAIDLGASLIGVNNRSLHTFDVSLDISRDLIGFKPEGALMITESGLSTGDEIAELRSLGFDGFLVGETLMRNGDPRAVLESWI